MVASQGLKEVVGVSDARFKILQTATERAGLNPEVLAHSIERLSKRGSFMTPPGALTISEVEFLDAFSGTTADPDGLFDAQLATAVAEVEQEGSALTTAEVAEVFGVTAGRVRQLLTEGRAYALPSSKGRGTTRLFPAWQFVDGKPIPHVGTVALALPESTHPLAVRAFFLNGRVETGAAEKPMTVAEWLLSDGGLEPVLSLARAEAYGL